MPIFRVQKNKPTAFYAVSTDTFILLLQIVVYPFECISPAVAFADS